MDDALTLIFAPAEAGGFRVEAYLRVDEETILGFIRIGSI